MQQTNFYYQILSGEITKKTTTKNKKQHSIQSYGPYMQHTFLTSCTILPSIINVSSMALKL